MKRATITQTELTRIAKVAQSEGVQMEVSVGEMTIRIIPDSTLVPRPFGLTPWEIQNTMRISAKEAARATITQLKESGYEKAKREMEERQEKRRKERGINKALKAASTKPQKRNAKPN